MDKSRMQNAWPRAMFQRSYTDSYVVPNMSRACPENKYSFTHDICETANRYVSIDPLRLDNITQIEAIWLKSLTSTPPPSTPVSLWGVDRRKDNGRGNFTMGQPRPTMEQVAAAAAAGGRVEQRIIC
eukprot:scaffold33664_cov124-Skeletonema_dohrnii-CCMP3373.AAC.2